jgi:signal transduction histidine kinase
VGSDRYPSQYSDFYGFRILAADGRVVAQHNSARIADLSPWRAGVSRTQDFWLRKLDMNKWMYAAGGVHLSYGGQDLWIEVMTLGDPAGTHFGMFARELFNDVWMPMLPVVVLLLGVATITVRHSLEPLVQTSQQAENLSLLLRANRLDADRLPREAAMLGRAINRLLDRVEELVKSQRLFIARAAHELRTPLSIMLLELERVDDPRVRRLEADVRSMSDQVDRLLTLARLENVEQPDRKATDPIPIARELIERMHGWAGQMGHDIDLVCDRPVAIECDQFALREALRNLIENAVKHSEPKAAVRVRIGPGARVAVENSGSGFDPETIRPLMEPFARGDTRSEGSGLGLAIVAQVAALHGASVEVATSADLGGASIAIVFPDPAPPSPHDDARNGQAPRFLK